MSCHIGRCNNCLRKCSADKLDAARVRIEAMEKILRDYAFTDRVDFTNMRNEAGRALRNGDDSVAWCEAKFNGQGDE